MVLSLFCCWFLFIPTTFNAKYNFYMSVTCMMLKQIPQYIERCVFLNRFETSMHDCNSITHIITHHRQWTPQTVWVRPLQAAWLWQLNTRKKKESITTDWIFVEWFSFWRLMWREMTLTEPYSTFHVVAYDTCKW